MCWESQCSWCWWVACLARLCIVRKYLIAIVGGMCFRWSESCWVSVMTVASLMKIIGVGGCRVVEWLKQKSVYLVFNSSWYQEPVEFFKASGDVSCFLISASPYYKSFWELPDLGVVWVLESFDSLRAAYTFNVSRGCDVLSVLISRFPPLLSD